MEKFLTRACIALFTCTVAVACDAQDPMAAANNGATRDAKPAAAATSPAPDARGPAEPGAPAGGGREFASLSECLMSCETGEKLATNRETCRLNCDGAYGVDATKPAVGGDAEADPVGAAATCMGRCYAAGSAQDTCADGCKTTAAAAPAAPSAAVLDQLSTCVRTCNADKAASPTNRATCELNCAQVARVAGPAQP